MSETMIRGMYECGIHRRPDRTNSKPDAPIEGQKETVTSLKESQKKMNDTLEEINGILKGGLKETNDILQEILEKVETWRLRTRSPA